MVIKEASSRGEVAAMPLEVYWAVAFSPLLTLIRAHCESQRPEGKLFKMTDDILWQTFDMVIKALKVSS